MVGACGGEGTFQLQILSSEEQFGGRRREACVGGEARELCTFADVQSRRSASLGCKRRRSVTVHKRVRLFVPCNWCDGERMVIAVTVAHAIQGVAQAKEGTLFGKDVRHTQSSRNPCRPHAATLLPNPIKHGCFRREMASFAASRTR